MKKIIVFAAAAALSVGAFAHGCGPCRPGGGWGRPGGWCRPCPPPPPPCHGSRDWWGRGGCNFWPGFIGGVVGGAVARTIVQPTPVVVSQPVVTTPVVVQQQPVVVQQPTTVVVQQPAVVQTQNVWVEGRYVDQVQANGTVVRVWNPGHYETR